MRSFSFYVSHPFCFDNRLSYALSKYPNFPALLRREMRSFFFYVSHPYKIFLFFENICEYYQVSSNALSTVFVLLTDFLMPFQNTLICRDLLRRRKAIIFLLCPPPLENLPIFWKPMWILSRYSQWAKHSFCFANRLSYALLKYPNFPALFRREKR